MTSSKTSRSKATLNRNYTKSYMITIQKHKKTLYVTLADIQSVLETLKERFPSFQLGCHSYEVGDTYKQLHLHGICTLKESFYYKYNNSINGFRLQWRPLYNKKGALSYILKDTHGQKEIQDEILSLNRYTHKLAPFGFIKEDLKPFGLS